MSCRCRRGGNGSAQNLRSVCSSSFGLDKTNSRYTVQYRIQSNTGIWVWASEWVSGWVSLCVCVCDYWLFVVARRRAERRAERLIRGWALWALSHCINGHSCSVRVAMCTHSHSIRSELKPVQFTGAPLCREHWTVQYSREQRKQSRESSRQRRTFNSWRQVAKNNAHIRRIACALMMPYRVCRVECANGHFIRMPPTRILCDLR